MTVICVSDKFLIKVIINFVTIIDEYMPFSIIFL